MQDQGPNEKTLQINGETYTPRFSTGNLWKFFGWEAVLFSVTLTLGIAGAGRIKSVFNLVGGGTVPISDTGRISLWQFFIYFCAATLFMYLTPRLLKSKPRKAIFFKVLFALSVLWGGILFLSLWLPDIAAWSIAVLLLYLWFKKPTILTHNVLLILGIAGAGAWLGVQFSPEGALFLILGFALYDFVAVYRTRHMVKLAKEMLGSGVILAFVIPPSPLVLNEELKEMDLAPAKFLILGGGDAAFPLILCASLACQNIIAAALTAVFALLGLFVSFWFFSHQKRRHPIPALPPIALFSTIGFFISRFF